MCGIAGVFDTRGLRPIIAGRWVDGLMIVLAGYAWIATAVLSARGFGLESAPAQGVVAVVAAMAGVALVVLVSRSQWLQMLATLGGRPLPSLGSILMFGLALRLLWCLSFPATPSSDGATYLGLAQRLVSEGHFEASGTLAYWPPGYAFFLAPWVYLFETQQAVVASQLSLYVVGALGCYKLAQYLCGSWAGRFSALLFSSWPNLIALAATPEKEVLVIALLPWILLGALRCSVASSLVAGAALGGSILVQPSLQLLLPALLVLMVVVHGSRKCLAGVLLGICAVAVVMPWTVRNHEVFGEFVLVSTNRGDVLYRASNPLAHGGYAPYGEIDFSNLDEVSKDRASKKAAVEWIVNDPFGFLALVPEKQLRFMGDDAVGVYTTLKRGDGADSEFTYAILKLAANAWWLLAWLVIVLLCLSRTDTALPERIVVWFFSLPFSAAQHL